MAEEKKKSAIALNEEKILSFWQERDIFVKSVNRNSKRDFVFYDGPPFATGLPHYGHLLASYIKDTIPRYKTMRGFRVRRRWGWDCHGLPVENLVERELGLKGKKDIETMGIGRFNDVAGKSVLRYTEEWKKIIHRIGRFVDMEDDYRTMDPSYTETIWWIFKNLYDKKLVYEGFKSMHLCPHCETTLANFEVNQGYKDITDISVTVEFEIIDRPKTYLLAWTTTPWTLPGNVALAINQDIEYVEVSGEVEGNRYILAKSRVDKVFGGKYKLLRTFPGADLLGLSYKPLFNYYSEDKTLKNRKNGWKVYGASFVTTEDGTGIVHIAPAFGEDDMKLGREKELPFVQHVGTDGAFRKEVVDFAGLQVKPKDDHQRTDVEIIKHLAHKDVLFAKEKLIHSYPHCWRCDTPLLNYASSSWFMEVTKIKDRLVKENKKVSWVPSEIGEGRFGNWLSSARDWAISRTRYWGAPLPVWKCQECQSLEVLGSAQDIKSRTSSSNTYIVLRHGEAESNLHGTASSNPKDSDPLTERGRSQVIKSADVLKERHIDLIVASPFMRAQQTAEIVRERLGLSKKQILTDTRLGEVVAGIYDKKPWKEHNAFFKTYEEHFTRAPEGGETLSEVRNRMLQALYDIDSKYKNKTILFVTHGSPTWLLFAGVQGFSVGQTIALKPLNKQFIDNAEIKDLPFSPLPHNERCELDFHRPFIDSIMWKCQCGGTMKRIPDVFDCWFESGAMPYGEAHYPFENKEIFEPKGGLFKKPKGYPADFIAEGLDQTRGWFYSMLVLGVGLFGRSPYKNVVVNGLILAEDGQKMSKRLQNYPDPMYVVDKYGSDALRYYLLSSPVVHGEDLRFIERGVDEVMKKLVMRLSNVVSFYELYAPKVVSGSDTGSAENTKDDVLDQWIKVRLDQVLLEVTKSLDSYELDRASRPIDVFIDDLSTWYLRRSRDRFKSDDPSVRTTALESARYVIRKLSLIIAPFMPFLAEEIFQKVRYSSDVESVHLADWPEVTKTAGGEDLLLRMSKVREIVSLGLEARFKAGVKVRQPLSKISVKNADFLSDVSYKGLILDELNVKEVVVDGGIGSAVLLDTTITDSLKEEGQMRELVRAIQEARKEAGLFPSDRVDLILDTDVAGRSLVGKFEKDIARVAGVARFSYENVDSEKVDANGVSFGFKLKKV